jgi:hypothetical protein
MRWCLRVKLVQNWERFRAVLLMTEEQPIVEDSKRDDFWGAVATKEDTRVLIGRNVLGRLLMELRESVRYTPPDNWQQVLPAHIPDFLLYEKPIGSVLKSQSPAAQVRRAHFSGVEAAG